MNKTGFGFLRLPQENPNDENSIDLRAACRLADRFLALGGDYFDTAYTYQNGASESALREAVIRRHPRESVRIADKLPSWLLKSTDDCRRFFGEQLARCGVDYFDVYLLHGLDQENYAAYERFGAFDFIRRMKSDGRILRTGFSYHGSPELLDQILHAHPEIDYVQLQINYLDWESISIQSRRCWEIARKHAKPIIVMEPVKGGTLARIPDEALALLRALDPEGSAASWAMRFVRDLEGVEIVLSGMNAPDQIDDNLRSQPPLAPADRGALLRAAEIIRSSTAVACTGCGYCLDGCPRGVPIPRLFALYNEYARSPKEIWKMEYLYADLTRKNGRAADCLACGACERGCPQKLSIIENLRKVSSVFDAKKNG